MILCKGFSEEINVQNKVNRTYRRFWWNLRA